MGYVLEKRGERVRILECGALPAQSIQELARKDIGTGISLFHLIRTDFDKTLLTNCLAYINREGTLGIASSRSWKLLLSKMKDMSCAMTPVEKRWAAKPFGKMQNPKGSVGVFRSAITEDLWLGVLDGCDRLSSLVTSRAEKYQPADEVLLDLGRVSLENLRAVLWNRHVAGSGLRVLWQPVHLRPGRNCILGGCLCETVANFPGRQRQRNSPAQESEQPRGTGSGYGLRP